MVSNAQAFQLTCPASRPLAPHSCSPAFPPSFPPPLPLLFPVHAESLIVHRLSCATTHLHRSWVPQNCSSPLHSPHGSSEIAPRGLRLGNCSGHNWLPLAESRFQDDPSFILPSPRPQGSPVHRSPSWWQSWGRGGPGRDLPTTHRQGAQGSHRQWAQHSKDGRRLGAGPHMQSVGKARTSRN